MTAFELYSRGILRLSTGMVHGDRLDKPDGTAQLRSPVCGSVVDAEICLGENARVSALALRANACALGQASAAIVKANAIGLVPEAIQDIRNRLAMALAGTGDMPDDWPQIVLLIPARDVPARHGAILLPYDALLAAADNARERYDARG